MRGAESRLAVTPAVRAGASNRQFKNVRDLLVATGAHVQRPRRALHLAAFDTNCRTGSGSIHRIDNECRRALFQACHERAGAGIWRRQDLVCAIMNDATPQKIAAAKLTVSKGSQVCTYNSILGSFQKPG
jgi:hypothetical protein